MSILRLTDNATLPPHPRDRFRLRRRTVVGPLRTLRQQRRGSGSWVVSFALFAAAVVAVGTAVVGVSERRAATSAQPADRPAVEASKPRVVAIPAAVAPAATAAEAPAPIVRHEAALPSENQPAAVAPSMDRARDAAAPNRQAAEPSPFDLNRLPVLETAGMGLEPVHDGASPVAAPARPAAKTNARRSAASAQR